MIQITNVRQGAILNHNHGIETDDALTITVQGICEGGYPVKINGVDAEMDGRLFSASVKLTAKENTIRASALTPYGTYSQEVVAIWDKKSFKRYNFYLDDHSFLFTDLAKERPAHAFDHFYLAALKRIHDQWGLRLTLNCFYRNDHHAFELKDMPDIWKGEFIANSDWLKLSFHSYSEFPDRPYAEATGEAFARDWDLVQGEIIRFAGEETYIAPVVMHWGNIHPACAQVCIDRGVKCYSTAFRLRVMGGPSLEDRQKGGNMAQIQARSMSNVDKMPATEGLALHYGCQEEMSYLKNDHIYYDPNLKICFSGGTVCSNLVPLSEIGPKLEGLVRSYNAKGVEVMNMGGHEQYSFPYYENYLPDHLERLETMAKIMAQAGYTAVFFNNGFLGNTAWN